MTSCITSGVYLFCGYVELRNHWYVHDRFISNVPFLALLKKYAYEQKQLEQFEQPNDTESASRT